MRERPVRASAGRVLRFMESLTTSRIDQKSASVYKMIGVCLIDRVDMRPWQFREKRLHFRPSANLVNRYERRLAPQSFDAAMKSRSYDEIAKSVLSFDFIWRDARSSKMIFYSYDVAAALG